jgi:hypothetical protein
MKTLGFEHVNLMITDRLYVCLFSCLMTLYQLISYLTMNHKIGMFKILDCFNIIKNKQQS